MLELGIDVEQTARADTLVEEALKTSAIEGETLAADAVRFSVGRQLGISDGGLKHIQDQRADGLVQILLDATNNNSQKLTTDRIYGWHAARATAQCELADLIQKGVLIKLPGGGRSTSYDLDWAKYGPPKP